MLAMRPAWDSLARDAGHTIFQSFDWNHAAARIFATVQMPFVVMAESDSGLAIIPACIDVLAQRLSFLGEELFDYRHPISSGSDSVLSEAWRAVGDFGAKHGLGFGSHSVRGEVASFFCLVPFTSAPCILASDLPAFHHPRLALNMRRLLRAGGALRTYFGNDSGVLKNIYTLKSQEPGSLFVDPLRIQMLWAMADTAGKDCEVFTLEQQSTLVAALVTFRDHNWRRFYTTYYSEAWARYSPGLTLLYHVVRESLELGIDCDFMTGAQPYKLRLATNQVPLYRINASPEKVRAAHVEPVVVGSRS